MKKEEINEIKINAHHPRGATFVLKNTMQTRVGAGPVSAQTQNKLHTDNQNKSQNHVGVACHATQGITLISLVITIIILLILAGVTINLTLGENGIFGLAEKASEKYQNESKVEQIAIAKLNNQIEGYISKGGQTNLMPDYSARVDILNYNNESNQYTTPKDGYILIPTFASSNNQHIYIYFDDFCVAFVGGNTGGYWVRDYIFLPISKDTKVYYTFFYPFSTDNYLIDKGCWFIPSK